MPPKKGKKKGKKGKKGGALGADPDEFKSFNIAQRQILQALFEKMQVNKEENDQIRRELKDTKKDFDDLEANNVSCPFPFICN